jgi:MoxR-like ATPase
VSDAATNRDPARLPVLTSAGSVLGALAHSGYVADQRIATTAYLGAQLGKPILVEGPAGTGKTALAAAMARISGYELVRLQCYEGLDESRALYEWNYRKQLLRIQSVGDSRSEAGWSAVEDELFSEEFLLERPLLRAIRSPQPVVLLVDEVDRLEVETEALLLEVLSEFQVTVPELGTIRALSRPLVFLTSNATRQLSEALKRRCLFLHLGYPSPEREAEIVREHLGDIDAVLLAQITSTVHALRGLELRKHPSISETIDWARTLLLLGNDRVDPQTVRDTLHVLLKIQTDIDRAVEQLSLPAAG